MLATPALPARDMPSDCGFSITFLENSFITTNLSPDVIILLLQF